MGFMDAWNESGYDETADKEDLYESSKPDILSEIEDELDLSAFKVNDKLNPDMWLDDNTIREDIQRRLLKIAYDYWKSLEMVYDYDDVTFTGSLANYNWSNYSDIDLHIVFDFRKLPQRQSHGTY